MANWVVIENEIITEYYDVLPDNWRHVSGLKLSINNLEYLKSIGWYPVNNLPRDYDSANFKEVGFEYTFENDQVTCAIKLLELTEEEKQQKIIKEEELLLYQFQTYLDIIRVERNKKLQDSDWTQLEDVGLTRNQEWKDKWRLYRQALRDVTNNFNRETFQWPEAPS